MLFNYNIIYSFFNYFFTEIKKNTNFRIYFVTLTTSSGIFTSTLSPFVLVPLITKHILSMFLIVSLENATVPFLVSVKLNSLDTTSSFKLYVSSESLVLVAVAKGLLTPSIVT